MSAFRWTIFHRLAGSRADGTLGFFILLFRLFAFGLRRLVLPRLAGHAARGPKDKRATKQSSYRAI